VTQVIKDKVVVITGASSGLGEAAARHLATHGAKLVLGARRLERLQSLAKELSLGNALCAKINETPSRPAFSVGGGEGNSYEDDGKYGK